ncbi:MAG: hypothetical protein ACQESR_17530 [Planctomycetota bacterium]
MFAFEGLGGFNSEPEEGELNSGRLSLSQVAHFWKPMVERLKGTEWHYYPGMNLSLNPREGVQAITTQAKEIRDVAKTDVSETGETQCYDRIVLLGYSYGGDSVVSVTKKLKDYGIRVDLVITADSYKKWHGLRIRGRSFSKTPNVTKWHNYYQKAEWPLVRASVFPGLPIRGYGVDGAETNEELDMSAFTVQNYFVAKEILNRKPENWQGKMRRKPHVWIPAHDKVLRMIAASIAPLEPTRADYSYSDGSDE